MKLIPKFKFNLRWVSILFFALLSLTFLGCDRKGPPIRFVLPEGFHGVFQISEDKQQGVDLIKSNGMFFVIVPTNGFVVIKDWSFQPDWHQETAIFPDGKSISEEDFDTNAVVLHDLFSEGHTNWILVGTYKEAQIAISRTGQPMPLARMLSEADVPHYGN